MWKIHKWLLWFMHKVSFVRTNTPSWLLTLWSLNITFTWCKVRVCLEDKNFTLFLAAIWPPAFTWAVKQLRHWAYAAIISLVVLYDSLNCVSKTPSASFWPVEGVASHWPCRVSPSCTIYKNIPLKKILIFPFNLTFREIMCGSIQKQEASLIFTLWTLLGFSSQA